MHADATQECGPAFCHGVFVSQPDTIRLRDREYKWTLSTPKTVIMDKENCSIEPVSNPAQSVSQTKAGGAAWMEIVKVAAIPLVTLVLGFVFNASINSRQARETNYRLYTEMTFR
jgi:hypothetical protein